MPIQMVVSALGCDKKPMTDLKPGQSPSICVHQSMNNEWQPVITLLLIYDSLMQLFF